MSWHNVLAFDVFGVQTIVDNPPPWHKEIWWDARPWMPQDDLLATNWLQQHGIGVNVPTAAQAVELVARDRSFHPVMDYLDSIEHDGKARLETMLSKYFGAQQSPYTAAVGRNMMISAVARIFDPGCKVDTVPISESDQGKMKSTAIKVLFDPWFTDDMEQLGSKDAAMQTAGVSCIELGELDAMGKAENLQDQGIHLARGRSLPAAIWPAHDRASAGMHSRRNHERKWVSQGRYRLPAVPSVRVAQNRHRGSEA